MEQSPPPQSSRYGRPMPLDLNRKVFLSHSGIDKDFVRRLHNALCRAYLGIKVSFFDEETLPKGKVVSMTNILIEAKTSELGVLVLSDAFFMNTRNPMLELEVFVATKRVKLLPLFLTISAEEFMQEERRGKWVTKWEEWSAKDKKLMEESAKDNNPVNVENWRQALKSVIISSGLERKTATDENDYIHKVVKEVIGIIGPAIPLSNGKVIHGKDRLCQVVDEMFKRAASRRFSCVQNASNCTQAACTSSSNSGFKEDHLHVTSDVVAIHGFAGLGKTTLCKWLCDYYHPKLSGRVCSIDVGSSLASHKQNSGSFRDRLQHVLNSLSLGNNAGDFYHFPDLSNDQLKIMLREQFSSMKDPVFLAIDNICSESVSQEEADLYLGCKFTEGSKIFITSRSERILADLSGLHNVSFSVVTSYIPFLTLEEARDIFVQEFPELREVNPELRKHGLTNQQEVHVNGCVNMCTISLNRYNPLMLKSLAAFIRRDRSLPNVDWKGRLAKLQLKGIDDTKDEVWRDVFEVFKMTYALLSGEARKVFLDLALFSDVAIGQDMYKWINMLHLQYLGQKTLDEIILQLQDVCFIEKDCFEKLQLLDLVADFGKYKARHEGEYMVLDASMPWPDHDHLPSPARHISISRVRCKASQTQLDLRDVEGVEVLHLVDNAGLQEVLLSSTTCAHLRSLIVIVPECTTLCCTLDEDWPNSSPPRRGGQFLKWMQLQGNVSFQRTGASQLSERGLLMGSYDMNFHSLTELEISEAADTVSILVCPPNLEALNLCHLPNVQSVDVTTCANLKDVTLWNMPSLKFIHGLEGYSQHLQKVQIADCKNPLALTVSANSGGRYDIRNCPSLERLSSWQVSHILSSFELGEGRLGGTAAGPSPVLRIWS